MEIRVIRYRVILFIISAAPFFNACNGIQIMERPSDRIRQEDNQITSIQLTNGSMQNLNELKPKASEEICWPWNTIDDYFVGQEMCIYGTIVKINSTPDYPIIVGFSEEPGTLVIRGKYGSFDFYADQCIVVRGLVKKDKTYLYINSEEVEITKSLGCD